MSSMGSEVVSGVIYGYQRISRGVHLISGSFRGVSAKLRELQKYLQRVSETLKGASGAFWGV